MLVAAVNCEQQDVVALARTIWGTTRKVDKAPPSSELVWDDLQEMAGALGSVFSDAEQAAARFCLLGWQRVESHLNLMFLVSRIYHTPLRFPFLLELWREAWRATLDYAEVALVPAKLLRDDLKKRLEEVSAEREASRDVAGPKEAGATREDIDDDRLPPEWDRQAWEELQGQTRRLLRYMQGREREELAKLVDEVWGTDQVKQGTIRTAVSRANKFLQKQRGERRTLEIPRREGIIRWA
jgi:hypothetical protein